MKTTSKRLTPWLAAAACLALVPGAKAADDLESPQAGTTHEMSSDTKSNEGAPARFNKASGIIGMDVRNQNDEHLGHVKDIVFDWKTERVSYAVISTAPKALLGMSEKLLAVPLAALAVSSDEKHLILNADKSKVVAATGFDHNNWPSVDNPSWGAEPVWQKTTDKSDTMDQPAKEPEATAKPDSDSEPKPGMENSESHSDMKPDAKPDSDPNTNSEMKPESKSDSDAEPKSDLSSDSESSMDPEAKPVDMDSDAKPDMGSEPKPDPEPKM